MKLPRFHLTWLMACVAVASLDFAAMRGLSDLAGKHFADREFGAICSALSVGALPMVNILAVGLLIGSRHRESRPFVLGFELLGMTALLLYLTSAIVFTKELMLPNLEMSSKLLQYIVGSFSVMTTSKVLLAYAIMMVIQFLPQLVIALVGGFLYHWDRRRIVMRITN